MNINYLYLIIYFVGLTLNSFSLEVLKPENKRWNEGLLLETTVNEKKDTINLRKILNGSDKTSYFLDQNNDTINYKTFQGKVVLLDFWFLNCKPCVVQLPNLNRIKNTFANENFELISFATNPMPEIKERLLTKTKLDFTIIPNIYLIGPSSYPQKYLLDKNGKLIDHNVGGSVKIKACLKEEKKYKDLINKLLY